MLTWLLRIARNVYLKRVRLKGRETPTDAIETLVTGAEAGPEQALIRLGEHTSLRAALSRLPEQYRTVLVLRDVQGLSPAEIGLILEKSEPTVRVLVHRARQRLQALYLEEENKS